MRVRAEQIYAILWTHGERTPQEAINWWNSFTPSERGPNLFILRERYRQLRRRFPHREVSESLTIGRPLNPQAHIHR